MSTSALLLVLLLLLVLATAALADGLFEDFHVVQKPRGTHGYRGMMGDFVQLNDGSLLFSYTDNDIMVIRSTDQGRTWGAPSVLVKAPQAPAKGNIAHPSFLRAPGGDLLLAYIWNTYPTTPYFGHNYLRRSRDEGKTWSDQYCYTPYPGYLPVHNDRLHVLSGGRLIAAAEYKAYLPSSDDHSGYVGMSFFSDDDGYSWQASKNTVDMYKDNQRVEVQEADVVELHDGRLLMFARTYSGWPVFAYSTDRGETWGPPVPRKDIPMPYAGLATVRRLPTTGDLLFIWIAGKSVDKQDPKVSRRCALAAAISTDDGQTLGPIHYIARDPEDDFGYQAVEFLPDNTVLVGYHARDGLHVARIAPDWFYK